MAEAGFNELLGGHCKGVTLGSSLKFEVRLTQRFPVPIGRVVWGFVIWWSGGFMVSRFGDLAVNWLRAWFPTQTPNHLASGSPDLVVSRQ